MDAVRRGCVVDLERVVSPDVPGVFILRVVVSDSRRVVKADCVFGVTGDYSLLN